MARYKGLIDRMKKVNAPIITGLPKDMLIDHIRIVTKTDQMKNALVLVCQPEDAVKLGHLAGKRVRITSTFQLIDHLGRPEVSWVNVEPKHKARNWLGKTPGLHTHGVTKKGKKGKK